MATLSLADITPALNLIYGDAAADQFRRDVLLSNLLDVVEDKNSTCTWPVKFTGRTSAGPQVEGYDPVDGDFTAHLRKQATLSWAEYFAWAKVSGLSQAIAAANGGPGVSVDLLNEEVEDAIDELAVSVNQDLYSGDVSASPTEIEGLARAVDSTGTYAGLAQGTYAEWASGENTLASASLSVEQLRTKLHRPFKDAMDVWPEFVVCDGTRWDAVSALFNDQTRQIVEVVTTQSRGEVNLKAMGGYRAILVDGIPYVEDRHATASTFYALHSRWLSIRQVPGAGSAMAPSVIQSTIKALTGENITTDEIAQMLAAREGRLQPTVESLEKSGDNMKVMIKVYMQLRLKRRGAASKLVLT